MSSLSPGLPRAGAGKKAQKQALQAACGPGEQEPRFVRLSRQGETVTVALEREVWPGFETAVTKSSVRFGPALREQ